MRRKSWAFLFLYAENGLENVTNLKIFVVNTPNTGCPVLGVFIILQRPRCFRVLCPNRRNRRRSLGRLWIRWPGQECKYRWNCDSRGSHFWSACRRDDGVQPPVAQEVVEGVLGVFQTALRERWNFGSREVSARKICEKWPRTAPKGRKYTR